METLTLVAAFAAIIKFFDDVLALFMQPPAIYFIAVALFGAVAKKAKIFIPRARG